MTNNNNEWLDHMIKEEQIKRENALRKKLEQSTLDGYSKTSLHKMDGKEKEDFVNPTPMDGSGCDPGFYEAWKAWSDSMEMAAKDIKWGSKEPCQSPKERQMYYNWVFHDFRVKMIKRVKRPFSGESAFPGWPGCNITFEEIEGDKEHVMANIWYNHPYYRNKIDYGDT
jgi:hypothetical protein